MKKLLMMTIALMTGSSTHAQMFQKTFYVSNQEVEMACKLGIEVAGMDRSKAEYFFNLLEGIKNVRVSLKNSKATTVQLSTPLESVFNICFNYTEQLKPVPSIEVLKRVARTRIGLFGEVKELTYAKDYNVAIAFLDSTDKEIKRYFATSKTVADVDKWKVNCKDGCKWSGENIYYFDSQKMEELSETIAKSTSMVVYASRGKGIEKYEVSSTLYPQFTEYDFTLRKLDKK